MSQSHSDIDSLKASVKTNANGVVALAQRQVDRVISPDTRRRAYDQTAAFAQAKPLLFTFLAIQLAFSFLPLLVFASFSLSTVVLALGSAVVFSLFWIGVALLVVVPTLCVTFSIGLLVWLWAVSSFVIARWLYNAMPVSVKGGVEVKGPNGAAAVVKKDEDGFHGHTGDGGALVD